MLQPRLTPPASLRAPIGRLHDARATSGHYRKARFRQSMPCRPGKLVVAMACGETGRTENGDTGRVKIQALETLEELQKDTHRAFQIFAATLSAGQEVFLGVLDLGQ